MTLGWVSLIYLDIFKTIHMSLKDDMVHKIHVTQLLMRWHGTQNTCNTIATGVVAWWYCLIPWTLPQEKPKLEFIYNFVREKNTWYNLLSLSLSNWLHECGHIQKNQMF